MDWKLAAVGGGVLSVVIVTLGILTARGAVSGEVITGLITGVAGWLLKSPLPSTSKPQITAGTINVG
jgi:hypothetical protein